MPRCLNPHAPSVCWLLVAGALTGFVQWQWYRKWQYRKEYSDNRDKRYVKNYHTFRESPHMRRMQMQMMHGM